MIRSPTVFVLGAGASYESGFPLGFELRAKIIELLHGRDCLTLARGIDADPDELRKMGNHFQESSLPSIDAWLECNPKFRHLGKICISQVIGRSESPSILMRTEWLSLVWNRMRDGATVETIGRNLIAFVTFNYDRSLEEFLYRAIRNTFTDATEEQCTKALLNIPIVHVHGQVGFLPWQEGHKDMKRPYDGSMMSAAWALVCANGIRVISEGQDDSPELQRAHQLLAVADNIYFLGFGYHRANLKRLRFTADDHGRDILGNHYPSTEIPPRFIDPGDSGFGRRIHVQYASNRDFVHNRAGRFWSESFPAARPGQSALITEKHTYQEVVTLRWGGKTKPPN